MSLAHQEEIDFLKKRITSLENRLGNINYEMKGLLLNKYYNPIEQGIKVNLLEI
jgi:hypothetical protein